jgi:hypothetical protein
MTENVLNSNWNSNPNMKSKLHFKKTEVASIFGLSGSVAILKIFYLNLEQSITLACMIFDVFKLYTYSEPFLHNKFRNDVHFLISRKVFLLLKKIGNRIVTAAALKIPVQSLLV